MRINCRREGGSRPFKGQNMNTIKNFLKDDRGKLSLARLVILIIILWFLGDWIVCVQSEGIYTLTANKMTLLMSVLSLKAVQKYRESKK